MLLNSGGDCVCVCAMYVIHAYIYMLTVFNLWFIYVCLCIRVYVIMLHLSMKWNVQVLNNGSCLDHLKLNVMWLPYTTWGHYPTLWISLGFYSQLSLTESLCERQVQLNLWTSFLCHLVHRCLLFESWVFTNLIRKVSMVEEDQMPVFV